MATAHKAKRRNPSALPDQAEPWPRDPEFDAKFATLIEGLGYVFKTRAGALSSGDDHTKGTMSQLARRLAKLEAAARPSADTQRIHLVADMEGKTAAERQADMLASGVASPGDMFIRLIAAKHRPAWMDEGDAA